MPYPATPKTWVAGDVLTAAQMNAELRDALLGAFPLGPPDTAWTSYTPTLTQSATVTKTVTYAKYQRIGRTIHVAVSLAITGAGTTGNAILAGLPVTAAALAGVTGVFRYFDAGNTNYAGATVGASTTTVQFYVSENGNAMGVNPAFGAANTDVLQFYVTYEAAT